MKKILLVGCGKMGSALLSGWLERGLSASDIIIVDPSDNTRRLWQDRVSVIADPHSIPADFTPDAVLLAVKPQVMHAVVPFYGKFSDAVFISVAAGKTTGWLESQLGEKRAVVRVMPNTPSEVRRGISVLYATAEVTEAQRVACTKFLEAVGDAVWIDVEQQMDAVTAVSGSGPAYVFWLAECMAQAGVDAGLPRALAERLARATVAGSGELLHQSIETAATLRQNVTSPQGTTFAALEVLMGENGLSPLMSKAVKAAADRSRELAQ